MKKITLLMLIVFTTITLKAQNKLVSEVNEDYDGVSWTKSRGSNYEYDSNNNVSAETFYNYDSGTSTWKLNYKSSYTYDVNNKLILEIFQDWNATTNQLDNDYRYSYAYTNGKCTVSISQEWVGSIWVNDSKSEYTYDSNGLQKSETYIWKSNKWVIDTRDTYTYGSNNKISEILTETWNGLGWDNSNKTILSYNANNKIIMQSYLSWNDSNALFENYYSFDYAWDATGNMTGETTATIYNNNTIVYYQDRYIYDNSSLMANFTHPFKDSTGLYYYYYDTIFVNKVLGYNSYKYNPTTSAYDILSSRTTYNYNNSIALGIEQAEIENDKISLFPNPTSDFLHIQNTSNTTIDKVIVTDLSGKTVLQQSMTNPQLNVQNLAKGMYLIQVSSGDKKWQSKFLKN